MSSRSPKRRPRRADDSSAIKCVFQRFMIVHQKLPELCIDGGLDEGASIEELSEQILYYYDARETAESRACHSTEEAVQFAGVCSALMSLPDAFNGDKITEDQATDVHLANATLVFIPLEPEHVKIVAVAQLARCHPDEKDTLRNGNPLAVRMAVQKCHELFCLLRGSIHDTFSIPLPAALEHSSNYDEESADIPDSVYPGMSRLYRLRKRLRRLKWETSRSYDSTQQEENAALIDSLEKEVLHLANRLPIASLRMQLRTHYDEYLAEASLIASATGQGHRCLIESVPTPISRPEATLSRSAPPCSPSPGAERTLERTIQRILDESANHHKSYESRIIGVSSFFDGSLIFSHKAPDQPEMVSNRIACLLMEFLSSYAHKMLLHSIHHQSLAGKKSPPRRMGSGFRRFLSGSLVDEDTILDPVTDDAEKKPGKGRFLAPPSLSMVNVSDRILQVDLSSFGTVWTPRVNLPRENQPKNSTTAETNIALFHVRQCSFLLYLCPGVTVEEESESCMSNSVASDTSEVRTTERTEMVSSAVVTDTRYSRLLERIANDLYSTVDAACDADKDVKAAEGDTLCEAGQHVIFADRSGQRLTFLSNDGTRKNQKKSTSQLEELSGVDCRHLLASGLPPEVVSAFDDVMNDVSSRLSASRDGDKSSSVQLCTYMPQGWIYAHGQCGKELYVFFDASKFVTVSDVQHAADRLREKLFNESYT